MPLSSVKRFRSEGKIPYVKIGRGRTIYLAESIISWLQSKEIREAAGDDKTGTQKAIGNGLHESKSGLPES
jgi:hypothetical protein